MASEPSRTRPAARRRPRKTVRRRGFASWLLKLAVAAAVAVMALLAWGDLARRFAPVSNTSLQRCDAIVVLGSPAESDGNPSPIELARTTEAVREYERGVAPRLIFTGGDVANRFVEARVMAQVAEAQGIPAAAVVLETHARDTIENACYATRIMQAHGWNSAEVVTSRSHAPRAAMIFSRMPLKWRMHVAPSLEPESTLQRDVLSLWEDAKTARYLVWARQMEHCQP